MDITITPRKLKGKISAIPSKSQAHRLLICAAFSENPTYLECPQTNEDIEATARCLCALGAQITHDGKGYCITPIRNIPQNAALDCGESGSTLRFLLPVVCALGVNATIQMHGRLPHRPLSPLWEELERMGCKLTRPTETTIETKGMLKAGNFYVNSNISSQFITGLLFAAALLPDHSTITINGELQSKPYIDLTQEALNLFGVETTDYYTSGRFPFRSPGKITVEGDWSNGAFFLAANALGNAIDIANLNTNSLQGDRAIADILQNLHSAPTISVADIPDLTPILAVVFGATTGAVFTDIGRLRLKESDRVASICNMINNLGAHAVATDNTLTVTPGSYHSCLIDTVNDHRIAMAAAIAATVAEGPITILGAECVAKSYPSFWRDYELLGGKYEQYLR